jgi:ribosomal protein L7/L12
MVEGAPKVIKANVSKADAEKIAEKLKSAGGEVVLE